MEFDEWYKNIKKSKVRITEKIVKEAWEMGKHSEAVNTDTWFKTELIKQLTRIAENLI